MADRSVVYEFRASVGQFRSQMLAAGASVRDLGTKLTALDKQGATMRRGLETVGSTAGKIGLVAGIAFGAAVKSAADFDASMSKVKAATHDSAAEMDQLRAAAIKAGALTKYSATEAADGITNLAKAGVSTKDILGGALNGALSLAAAGEISVADAAEYTATALTQFGLKGTQAGHVADLLAAGAGKAQGEVADMANALDYAGIPAAQLGVSIEQTAGTLALFAKNGLIGEKAGTGLRGVLLSLTSPSKIASDTMQQYGINVFDATGKFIGLDGVAAQFHDRLGNLTQQERANAMGRIFGNEQIQAANILYKEGAKGIEEWTKKVNDAGYAQESAAIQMDNLKGDLEQLRGSFETLLIGSGEGSQGPLRGLVQGATTAVNALNNLPGPLKTVTNDMLGVVAVLGGGLWFGSKAIGAVSSMKAALRDLGIQAKITRLSLSDAALAGGVGAAITFGLPDVLSSTNSVLRDFNLARSAVAQNLDDLRSQLEQSNVGKYAADLGIDVNKLSADLYNNGKSGEYVTQVLAGLSDKASAAGGALDFLSRDIPGYTNNSERAAHAQENLNEVIDKNAAVLGTGQQAVLAQKHALTGLTAAQRTMAHTVGLSDKDLQKFKQEAVKATDSFLNLSAGVKKSSFSFKDWITSLRKSAEDLRNFRMNAASAIAKGLDPSLVTEFQKMGAQGAAQLAFLAHASVRDIEAANRAWAQFGKQQDLTNNAIVRNLSGMTTAEAAAATATGLSVSKMKDAVAGLTASFDNLPPAVQVRIGEQGLPTTQAGIDHLADTLRLNKWEKRVLMSLVDNASPGINSIKALLNSVRDKTVTVTTNIRRLYTTYIGDGSGDKTPSGGGKYGAGMFGGAGADGMTVPGPRYPYADKVFIHAAPGEEVITNRNGEADRFRADRAAGRIPRYADGGTVGGKSWQAADGITTRASSGGLWPTSQQLKIWGELGVSTKTLNQHLKEATNTLDKEKQARTALVEKMNSLSSDVQTGIRSDLFGQNDPWQSQYGATSPQGVMAALTGDIAKGNQFKKAISTLKAKGLKGDALAAILRDGGLAGAQEFAGMSRKELAQYASLYNQRDRIDHAVGSAAAGASYGAQKSADSDRIDTLTGVVRRIEHQLNKHHREAEANKNARHHDSKRGAASSGRKVERKPKRS